MVKIILPKGARTYRIHPRVPERYRAVVGATHVSRSLGTRDPVEAKRRVHAAMAKLEAEWDALLKAAQADGARALAAPKITSSDGRFCFDSVQHACGYFFEHQRGVIQFCDRAAYEEASADPERFWRGEILPLPDDLDRAITAVGPAVVAARSAGLHRERGAIANMLVLRELSAIERVATAVFCPPHCHDREFLIALGRTWLGLLDTVLADETAVLDYLDEHNGQWVRRRGGGEFPLMVATVDVASPDTHRAVSSNAPVLSVVLEDFITERGAGLSAERQDILRAIVRDLRQVCGDRPINTYTKADAAKFKGVLLRLPANLSKRRDLRELPLDEAAERAEALGLRRQSAKNLRKKWAYLTRLFRFADNNHDGVTNPFLAKALEVSDGVADADQWEPFRPDELRTLLDSTLPGPLHWLTWLGLYGGFRANEMCQLSAEHVRQTLGVHYICLPPTLRLKRNASVRSVPVHPDLIKMGFLEFVKAANGGALFPGLTVHRSGRMSDATGKAFARHLVELGLKRPKLSFNSLRHNFKSAWDRVHPQAAETRERLIGHVVPGVSGRYGNGYRGEALDMELLSSRAKLLAEVRFISQAPEVAQPSSVSRSGVSIDSESSDGVDV